MPAKGVTAKTAAANPIEDRYHLQRKIGEGYTSVVYLADQPAVDQRRAVKILKPERAHDPEIVDELFKEVARQAVLTHRNIVKIVDFGNYRGRPAIVQNMSREVISAGGSKIE